MDKPICFTIPGEPCAKARPRFTRQGRAYTPAKTADYEALIRRIYGLLRERAFFGGAPLELTVLAKMRIPRSAGKAKAEAMRRGEVLPTKRPDVDNFAKIVCDALNGMAYRDDAQVVDLHVHKRYADEPMMIVMLRPAREGLILGEAPKETIKVV